ncbi:MAG: tetratricopeptide repeat protein [Micavibrio sp.]|nr:tetratricopeptide repeat protein [Micavibrio sp.]
MKPRFSAPAAALMLVSALALSGCHAKPIDTPYFGKAADSLRGQQNAREMRQDVSADAALFSGNINEALRLSEISYKANKKDAPTVLRYATLLRKTGNPAKGLAVLHGFATNKAGDPLTNADATFLNEAAADNIALGDFSKAEIFATAALKAQPTKAEETDAYNLMGVALDARGAHKDAEQMFRMALDGWQGNPTSVMNNLGLSLASQGKYDESLSTLRKALVIAPDKTEIARNIDLISKQRDAVIAKAPVTVAKAPVKTVKKPAKKKTVHHHHTVKKATDCKTVTVCNKPAK